MFEELGISFGTALIVLLTLYFIVKWAVKNGIKEAYRDITGKMPNSRFSLSFKAEEKRFRIKPTTSL